MVDRLTKRDIDGCPLLAKDEGYLKLLDRLAKYEDAEEQGLLIRLPCNFGDICYEIVRLVNEERKIIEHPLIRNDLPFLDKIYATREEAEAAIKEGRF